MNRLHVIAQFTFRIVPTVAYTTGDSSQLWLCHERLPPKSSLASFNSANLSWATLRAGKSNLYHSCTTVVPPTQSRRALIAWVVQRWYNCGTNCSCQPEGWPKINSHY